MGLETTAVGADKVEEMDKKRKSTETEMANPSDNKKQKKEGSSLLLKKSRTAPTETAVKEKPGEKGEKVMCPRARQWVSVKKFCLKMHKVSNMYQDDHEEFKKFKAFAVRAARKTRYCNNFCPGPITDKDDFRTEWSFVDKNRWFMFLFLRQVQKLEESFKKTCLKITDKPELDTIRRAKINLKIALSADPVLEYVEQRIPELNECGAVSWTKSEKHRLMFIYRLKKDFKPNITWDKVNTFFNCRNKNTIKMKLKEMIKEARAKPLTNYHPRKKKVKKDGENSKDAKNSTKSEKKKSGQ